LICFLLFKTHRYCLLDLEVLSPTVIGGAILPVPVRADRISSRFLILLDGPHRNPALPCQLKPLHRLIRNSLG